MATVDRTLGNDWFVVGRAHQYVTEQRIGWIRIIAIPLLYMIHLFQFLLTDRVDAAEARYHWLVTVMACGWMLFGIVVLVALYRHVFPKYLGWYSTGVDLMAVLALAALGTAAQSPMVSVLFLVLISTALRFDVRLVWCTTAGVLVGYLFLLGIGDECEWFDAQHTIPPSTQGITFASLLFAGIFCGQVVRRVKAIVEARPKSSKRARKR